MDLFDDKKNNISEKVFSESAPLADRMRPLTLDEFVGQEHILGEGKPLRNAIVQDKLSSIILWGPPGVGKTTLAYIIARMTSSRFIPFSAVVSGIKEVKDTIYIAEEQLKYNKKRTIVFIDEIHRFNKAQQDAFLPHVEKGTIILIGATTENPSFEVISALLSRSKVFVLKPLTEEQLEKIITKALKDNQRGLGKYNVDIEDSAIKYICALSDGDARASLNTLELAVQTTNPDNNGIRRITLEIIKEVMQKKSLLYDKSGEEHYNLISALHKSMRGSDPDASLYWLGRMLESGEDPLYIARRIVRFASEDIGMADPQALVVAISAMQAVHFVGMPEGNLALAQAVVYMATAPKSNALYTAYNKVVEDIRTTEALPVPLHIRNAPTKLMKDLEYGKGYKYAHDFEGGYVKQEYLPENLKGRIYYEPTDRGFELEIKKRLEKWRTDLV